MNTESLDIKKLTHFFTHIISEMKPSDEVEYQEENY
jgi:hypothetical protein